MTEVLTPNAITFVKAVVGGSAQPDEWSFAVEDGPQDIPHNGQVNLIPGIYTVSEDSSSPNNADYVLAAAAGSCAIENGEITLLVTGQAATCNITNVLKSDLLTIVKDAQPNSVQDFRFTGDLGDFRLDNVLPDDGDAYTQTQTFQVELGLYRVREEVPGNWVLTDITGDPADSGAVNLAEEQVTITFSGISPVTCTFINQRRSIIRIEKYYDDNGDARRNLDEVNLAGWTMRVYDAQQNLIAAQVTNEQGKVSFPGLRPGDYTVCEESRDDWVNTQPGLINATFEQPCYVLTAGPGQIAQVYFGNVDHPVVSTAQVDADTGVLIFDAPDTEVDEAHYAAVDTDEAWLNTPLQTPGLFMPQIQNGK